MRWGLALSGGGILGAAHLGVWRALRDMGLRPGIVSGTSAGGLVAGMCALGVGPDAVIEAARRVCRTPSRYFRPQLGPLWRELLHRGMPVSGVLDPTAFVRELLTAAPGAATTGDWVMPAALTACDLVHLRPTAFVTAPGPRPLRGDWAVVEGAPLALALHATMAEPVLYTAAEDGDHVYVDGGLADIVPEDWAVTLGAERVLAVDVAPPGYVSGPIGIEEIVGRSIAFVLKETSVLRRPRRPVLRLLPDTSGVGLFGFSHCDALVEAGYACVQARAADIRAFVESAP